MYPPENGLTHAALSRDNRFLAYGDRKGEIGVLDIGSNSIAWRVRAHTGMIRSIVVSPDGLSIATGSVDHTVKIWSAKDGTWRRTLVSDCDAVSSVSFSPDGSQVASTYDDGSCVIWSVEHGTKCQHIPLDVSGLAIFSHDGKRVVAKDMLDNLCIWNIADVTKTLCLGLSGLPPRIILAMVLSSDERLLACYDAESCVSVLDIWKNRVVFSESTMDAVFPLRITMDNEEIVAIGLDRFGILRTFTDSRYLVNPDIQDMICEKYGLPGGRRRLLGPFAGIARLLMRW